MAADPVVSPADTPEERLTLLINDARALGNSVIGVTLDLAVALLAVGERDKAEIERLRERLDECKRWHDD